MSAPSISSCRPQGSVSRWLDGLKASEGEAAAALWDRYGDRLVRLARKKLRHIRRRVFDEEDIAVSAFKSLCLGARKGRFPALADRDSLWGLLVFITAQKVADRIAHEHRKKRGSGKVRGHSALIGNGAGSVKGDFDRFVGSSPGPATLNAWAEEYDCLLKRLGDETLRTIAELGVQGYKIYEIAERLGLARRTIHRKLDLIRKILSAETPP
jgi:DNA-directed RNA polymerase specialized sigma24 family protein